MFGMEMELSAVSGATLMDMEFAPQEFVVRGLLPNGLSIFGYATAAFTLDVYGHITEKMKRDSAAKMERFIKEVNV